MVTYLSFKDKKSTHGVRRLGCKEKICLLESSVCNVMSFEMMQTQHYVWQLKEMCKLSTKV